MPSRLVREASRRPSESRVRHTFTALLAAPLLAAALLTAVLLPAPAGQPIGPAPVRAADDPFFTIMQLIALDNGKMLVVDGSIVTLEDFNPFAGAENPAADITHGSFVELPAVPDFLLSSTFSCGNQNVVCPSTGSDDASFGEGAYLFFQRLAAPPEAAFDVQVRLEFGPILKLNGYPAPPATPGDPFGGASHAVITRVEGPRRDVLYFANQGGTFQTFRTRARTRWDDTDVVYLIPRQREIPTAIDGWDLYAYWSRGTPATTGRDNLRGFKGEAMLPVASTPSVSFTDAPAATPTSSAISSPTSASSPTATPTGDPMIATPLASAPPGSSGTGILGGDQVWLILLLIGLGIAGTGLYLLWRPGGGPRRPGPGARPAGGPGGPAIAGDRATDDPCPPLIAAVNATRAACETARAAAGEAVDASAARRAEADAAQEALGLAQRRRETAERELARRQRPPDRGGDSASTTHGGRTVTEDSYELHLLEEARAAANAAWGAAKATATTDAERQAANDAWVEELQRLDGPDGIDEIRRRDAAGRARWIKEAEEELEQARSAEIEAQARLEQAISAVEAAARAADEALLRADRACAEADAALRAAAAAGCLTPGGPAGPVPTPQPPGPDKGDAPPPDAPPPTPPDARPPTPPAPRQPTPPTPSRTAPRKPVCPDGTEEWRPEGPTETFLVPVPGEKVQIDVAPSLEALDRWLENWRSVGVDLKPIESPDPLGGVPPAIFRRIDNARWNDVFRAVGDRARRLEITFTLPLQDVRLRCERLYRCVEGQWVRQDRCRATEVSITPRPKTLRLEGESLTRNEAVALGTRAVNEWQAAEQRDLDRAGFSSRCCR